MLALSFPFKRGDEVLVYDSEYPSVVYPWFPLAAHGVELKWLKGAGESVSNPPLSITNLERVVSSKTRVLALSHVQFVTGAVANLEEIGSWCQRREITLVVDAAQSLGALPIYPSQWGVDCLVASGWKWMLGPTGSGVLYTSQRLREQLTPKMLGPDMMKQDSDYLNYTVDPYEDGRQFEPSTLPHSVILGLTVPIEELQLKYGIHAIYAEIVRLLGVFRAVIQDHPTAKSAIQLVDTNSHIPSGILSIKLNQPADPIRSALRDSGFVCTCRNELIRIAPHFYNTDEQLHDLALKLIELAS
jgi:selenocysteine lyase/cysteine desulfurase